MLRLGAMPDRATEMDLDHIFISRLELLIVMARSYLGGYPLGSVRRSVMVRNADHIAAESLDLWNLASCRNNPPARDGMDFDPVFYQRVKLLALMLKAIGNDRPMGDCRKTALRDNLERISESLKFSSGVKKVTFLKVA